MDSENIAAIKLRYRQSLSEKSKMVAEHLDAAKQQYEELSLGETRAMLHKLAGSSGMYGYDDISIVCREAMTVADAGGDIASMIRQLGELKRLLDKHA